MTKSQFWNVVVVVGLCIGMILAIGRLWGVFMGPLPYDPYQNEYADHFLEMEKSMKFW
jgi:hypothetical protein